MSVLHALSIDLEEWHHPELVRRRLWNAPRFLRGPVDAPSAQAGAPLSLARAATLPILDLLDRHGTKATFFVVGEVARRCPDLMHEIVERGHEPGCHTCSHRPLGELTPASLSQELQEFRALMRDILGSDADVIGFRAPTFSLHERTGWAIDVLADHGFRYDSSIFPHKNYLYGVAGAPDAPYRIGSADVSRPDPAGRLIEFPMSVYRFGRVGIPVSGGAYLRLLPTALFVAALRRVARERTFIIYVHPWETSRRTPRVAMSPWSWLITYYNRGGALRKLEVLLRTFAFAPLRVVLEQKGLLD